MEKSGEKGSDEEFKRCLKFSLTVTYVWMDEEARTSHLESLNNNHGGIVYFTSNFLNKADSDDQ